MRWKYCLFGVSCHTQQYFSHIVAAVYLTRFLCFRPIHTNSLLVAGHYPTWNRGGWRKSPQGVGPARDEMEIIMLLTFPLNYHRLFIGSCVFGRYCSTFVKSPMIDWSKSSISLVFPAKLSKLQRKESVSMLYKINITLITVNFQTKIHNLPCRKIWWRHTKCTCI